MNPQSRRGFMKMLGALAPATLVHKNLGQKLTADSIAGTLSRIQAAPEIGGYAGGMLQSGVSMATRRAALLLPEVREKVRSIFAEQARHNTFYIDPDIAVMHSLSFNAKLCFQKQRNVENMMKEQLTLDYCTRMNEIFEPYISIFQGGGQK